MQYLRMHDDERRELWRIATKENGWRPEDIGERLGISAVSLKTVVSRGSKRSKIAPALDAWLAENARKLANEAMRHPDLPDPFNSVGLWMVSVGQDLQSRFLEPDQKIDRLIDFQTQLNKRIKSDIAAMEKWIERGN